MRRIAILLISLAVIYPGNVKAGGNSFGYFAGGAIAGGLIGSAIAKNNRCNAPQVIETRYVQAPVYVQAPAQPVVQSDVNNRQQAEVLADIKENCTQLRQELSATRNEIQYLRNQLDKERQEKQMLQNQVAQLTMVQQSTKPVSTTTKTNGNIIASEYEELEQDDPADPEDFSTESELQSSNLVFAADSDDKKEEEKKRKKTLADVQSAVEKVSY